MMIYIFVIAESQNSENLPHVKNQKLRKNFCKGANFRDPQSLNYSRCKKDIDQANEEFSRNLRLKHKLENVATDLAGKQSQIKSKKQDKVHETVKTNL